MKQGLKKPHQSIFTFQNKGLYTTGCEWNIWDRGVFTFQNKGLNTEISDLCEYGFGVFTFQNKGFHTLVYLRTDLQQLFLPFKIRAFTPDLDL